MIKKHKNKNEYYYAGNGLWIRNFIKKSPYPLDINNLIPSGDMQLLLDNESANKIRMLQRIDTESFNHPKIAIVNSGTNFEKEQHIISALPPDVTIIGVNETIVNWKINRRMHYYVVNNPYKDCLTFLPSNQTSAKCIASTRTNPDFVAGYNGFVYEYSPVHDAYYAGIATGSDYLIDDYRNPLCAAICLSYKFGVKKILLLFPDETYDKDRPSTIKINDNMWMYPQQMTGHQLVDGNLYWLKEGKISTGVYSYGPEYKHATYIEVKDFVKFFN